MRREGEPTPRTAPLAAGGPAVTSFASVCAAHAPLALNGATPAPQKEAYLSALKRCGDWIRAFAPDVIVEFAPDHLNCFFYNLMPHFCMGLEAVSIGDWATPKGSLTVPSELALNALNYVHAADVDLALSYRMTIDHGFTQLLALMFDDLNAFPVIPIMINCAAPPRPNFRRARLLGQAIGEFFKQSNMRVLFLGSGGLSHDPPILKIDEVDLATREALIVGAELGVEARAAREGNVIRAAKEFVAGRSASRPPNREWDRAFMDLMKSGNIRAVESWTDEDVTAIGGLGGHEVRTWVAAFAALSAATGTYSMDVEFYDAVVPWMTGMGIVRAW
jgi:2,3-dihydroxyphenylpropionate 1,2-dioxygenase